MRAGPLRHRVILERPTESQDDGGQVVSVYVPVSTRTPAEIEDIAGREYFAGAQINGEVTTRIRIRWRDDIDETWRVRFIARHKPPTREELYDIAAVIRDKKTGRTELQLMCIKRKAEGWRRGDAEAGSGGPEPEESSGVQTFEADAAQVNDLPLEAGVTFLDIETPDGDVRVTGISAATAKDKQQVTVTNRGPGQLTIAVMDADSVSSARVRGPADISLPPEGSLTLRRSTALALWVLA